jgi:hypothetical protein
MAIRYSGDVELRIEWLKGNQYSISLSSPNAHWNARVRVKGAKGREPEAYDRVAEVVLKAALARAETLPVERSGRGPGASIMVRRVFQAPCPIADHAARRRSSSSDP